MGIIKLQNEGESHTMTVTECKTVTGNYGEQVLFSDGSDTLYLPKQSADRQLERLGLDESSVVGMNVTFSRDPNPKKGAKPYWGISYAGTEAAAPKASPRVTPPKATTTDNAVTLTLRRMNVALDYLALWDLVSNHLKDECDITHATLTADAIQAATATIWITWDKRGIQPDGLDAPPPSEKELTVRPGDHGLPPEIKMPAPSGKRLAPPVVPDARPGDDDLPF
jgi:hypothetical protein